MSDLRLAVKRAAKSHRGGIEGIASFLNMKGQVLRNQLNGLERHRLLLEVAEDIVDLCDSDELAHAAAIQRGGVFIKLPADALPASDLAVLELVTHVWRANGDVGKAVDDTLADGRVEHHEIAEVRKSIYRMQQAMTAMLSRLEEMAE